MAVYHSSCWADVKTELKKRHGTCSHCGTETLDLRTIYGKLFCRQDGCNEAVGTWLRDPKCGQDERDKYFSQHHKVFKLEPNLFHGRI